MLIVDFILHILFLFMLNISRVSCSVSVSEATVTIWAIMRSAPPTSERSWRTYFPTWRRAGSAWGANPNILLLKLSVTILLNGQASVVAVHAPPKYRSGKSNKASTCCCRTERPSGSRNASDLQEAFSIAAPLSYTDVVGYFADNLDLVLPKIK